MILLSSAPHLLPLLILLCGSCEAFLAPLPSATSSIASSSRSTPRSFGIITPSTIHWKGISYQRFQLFARNDDNDESDDDDEEEDDDIDLGDQDWRAFRAKLVMSDAPEADDESATGSTEEAKSGDASGDLDGIGALFGTSSEFQMTPLDPSQWAYDSGKVIEQGAVILGGVEQEYGFGLRQQYFHKAAILVLDHDEKQFTKGIILNRPTDLTLEDDINEGVKWRVWFGGDVQGLNSMNPDIVCLHSLKNDQVMRASISVMNDIQWTTFDNAKRLVKVGAAAPSDFWVFCGYAGWGPDQLMGELDRKSWYMVATDSQTLLQELARQTAGADPREAGLDTWNLLMGMIRKQTISDNHSGGFDDLMLKEWALKFLLSEEAGGGGEMVRQSPAPALLGRQPEDQPLLVADSIDDLLESVAATGLGKDVAEGTIVRASSADRSPFLLDEQELHKSLILVISDDESISVGVILNRPAAKGIDIQIKDKNTGLTRTEVLPLRYGGQYAIRGGEPLIWLHRNSNLKSAGVGAEIGDGKNGIYKCKSDDISAAIGQGIARPEDFMVVSGVSVWTKGEGGLARGMQDEVRTGKFEVTPPPKTSEVWRMLLMQDVLSKGNLVQNLALAGKAWLRGAGVGINEKEQEETEAPPIGGLGDNFDEEDSTLVFKSDVRVADLSDKALRSWVATFLLGAPSLDES